MKRIRQAGPEHTVRPFKPNAVVMDDPEGQRLDALEHIARALSAIDHNLEALLAQQTKQTAAIEGIAHVLPRILSR